MRLPLPQPLVTGLANPTSAAVGLDNRVYVTVMGEPGKDGDGSVLALDKGRAVPFASGLDDPRGVVAFFDGLFVADRQRVWRIDAKGKADLFAPPNAFPIPPRSLGDIAVDPESGTFFVSDAGDAVRHWRGRTRR